MKTSDDENKKAFDCAVYYLGLRERSEKQLRDYLVRKEYETNSIDYAVKKLKEYNYINDERYAQSIVRQQSQYNHKSKRTTANKLWQIGIDKDISDTVLEVIDEESEQESALFWARKIDKRLQNDEKRREKMYRRLSSKGFSYSIVQYAMDIVLEKEEE